MADGSELTKLDCDEIFAAFGLDLEQNSICGCNEISWIMKMPFKKADSFCKNNTN